jgi:hypothetical protein
MSQEELRLTFNKRHYLKRNLIAVLEKWEVFLNSSLHQVNLFAHFQMLPLFCIALKW